MDKTVLKSISSLKYKLMKDNNWSEKEHKEAEQEYVRFLTLRQLNPSSTIAPSELMDKVWHAHILNTESYAKDCDTLFGKFLHHIPHLVEGVSEKNNVAFDLTESLYAKLFGSPMVPSAAGRCEGKACHVESECRCR